MSDQVVAPDVPILGLGDLPPELDRPNWAAFAFGPLWAIAYRIWPVFWLFAGLILVDVVVENAVLWVDERLWARYVGNTFYVVLLLWRVLAVWVSLNANRLLWERESRRLLADDRRPGRSLHKYTRSLGNWTVVAAIVLGLEVVNAVTLIVQGHYGWLFGAARAAIVVGLLVYDRLVAARRKPTSAST